MNSVLRFTNPTLKPVSDMLQTFVSAADSSACAEFALALFAAAFAVILWGTMRLSRGATDRFASIPLNDQVEEPFSE